MSIFSIGKKFLYKHPSFLNVSATIYNALSFNSIRGRHGNQIVYSSAFLKKCRIRIIGTGNTIIFGKKCYLNKSSISIVGSNNTIIIKDMVVIHKGELCIEDKDSHIIIDEKCLLCGPTHLAAIEGTTIHIKKNALFSSETVLRTGDSHSILDLNGNRINPSQDIIIGENVWVGHRALITKGVSISDNCVIATGAIVTKSINESHVIIGGVPAKVIKQNISWQMERV